MEEYQVKKNRKRIFTILGGIAMAAALAACGASGNTGSANSTAGGTAGAVSGSETTSKAQKSQEIKSVNVHIPTVYELPDAKVVEEAINEITEGKYGIHLSLNFITSGNWKDQSNLLFTGDEADVIAVYQTPLTTFVKNGQLADLTDYHAGAGAAFKEVWTDEELKGTTVDGRLYAIPNMRNFGNTFGLTIDAEIAEEFGVRDGQKMTMADVDQFIRAAHAAYPDRYALAPKNNCLINQWTWDGLGDQKYIGVLEDCGQDVTVKNLFETDDFVDFVTWAHKWYKDGLVMQDILSNTQPWQQMIRNKQAIACINNYSVNKVAGMISTVIIDKWAVSNSYTALCYGININTKDMDAAWKAMEILYTDTDVAVLLNDGIEGRHYIKNENGTISYPNGMAASESGYGMAEGYWLTPYSAHTYPLDVNGPTFFEDLLAFNEATLKSKAFGFSFNTADVVDQYTACSNVMEKYYTALLSGAIDPEATIAQANEELKAAGIDDVIKAKQEQLDAFLNQ